jgi:hypothetical protein
MILKQGVKIVNLKPQMILGIMIANEVYKAHSQELVITSCDDSKHGNGTLHGQGFACDFRTSFFLSGETERVANEIRAKCDDCFDVVNEIDHIHMEYDPI